MNFLSRLKTPRKALINDLVSGLIMSIVTVPGALANGLLAGVNPVYGVYSVIAGTSVAALFTSSVIMNVDSTGATAIATGDFLVDMAPDQHLAYLVVLGLLVGAFMLIFGLLKLGFLVRFISNAVMTGFLSGLGVLTIMGQWGDLTGYYSEAANKVFKTVDTVLHFQVFDWPTTILGLITIVILVLLGRTQWERYSFAVAVIVATGLAFLPFFDSSQRVGDMTDIPSGLPMPHMPDLSLIPSMIIPALTIAIIALVQASGVSGSMPNPDGDFPDASGDFRGQGMANLSVGLFGGIAVGGSLSGTTLIQSIGGVSRWANIFTALFTMVILLLFAQLIALLPLTALAGLLIVVGVSMIKVSRIQTVWRTGPIPLTVMLVTFVATLFLPLQFAVATGVILTVVLYVFRSAEKVRIERIVPTEGGGYAEEEAPETVPAGEIVIIQPIGSLFFAGVAEFEEALPDVGEAYGSAVIFRLRDRDEVGSTFIRLIERYARALEAAENCLILAGLNKHVLNQLEKTKIVDLIGRENIFLAKPRFGASLQEAVTAAEQWIAQNGHRNTGTGKEES
jgi:SulP family sulfate permease